LKDEYQESDGLVTVFFPAAGVAVGLGKEDEVCKE
jgi:hypothetical protein